ncbi:MAG: hypothetical protein AVDCRST_MAG40-2980, partial [uncultured Gemmatimonadaceae bacterium]
LPRLLDRAVGRRHAVAVLDDGLFLDLLERAGGEQHEGGRARGGGEAAGHRRALHV